MYISIGSLTSSSFNQATLSAASMNRTNPLHPPLFHYCNDTIQLYRLLIFILLLLLLILLAYIIDLLILYLRLYKAERERRFYSTRCLRFKSIQVIQPL